jgi:transposase
MIQLQFTEADIKIFQHERYHHPHVMRKMEVLYLKSLGLPHGLIYQISGVSPNTMRSYLKEYLEGGIEKVRELNFYRPKSDLETYTSSIEAYLQANPPTSISHASFLIEQLTGIKRGITQTGSFLKSLGFSFRKAGTIPSKAMPEEKNGTTKVFGRRIDTPP